VSETSKAIVVPLRASVERPADNLRAPPHVPGVSMILRCPCGRTGGFMAGSAAGACHRDVSGFSSEIRERGRST
jgi:hypothetical protein